MSDLNVCTLVGRITRDAEVKTLPSGTVLVEFGIANNTGFGKYECTNFFNVNAWGKQAQSIVPYLKKGKQVGISGTMENKSWTDQSGVRHDKWTLTTQGAISLLADPKGSSQPSSPSPATEDDMQFPPF